MTRALWPLIVGAFALGLDAYVLAGLLPAMAHDLGTDQAMIGLGVSTFTAAYAISAPALASVAGRTSVRAALLLGLGLFALGNAVTTVAQSLAVLLVARLLAGVGAGLYAPLAASSAASLVEPGQRGRALAAVLAGLSAGTALGVPVGLLVEARFGWRWTIVAVAVLGLAAAAGVASRNRFPPSPALGWRDRLMALRAPFTRATLGVSFWTGVGSLGLYTYLAEVAADRGMVSSTGTFIWAWGLGGMTGALVIGRVIDRRLPPARATPLILITLLIGFALVGWSTPFGVEAGCFLWGLAGWASVAPQQHALVTRDPVQANAAIAWNASSNYLGGAVGAALGALVLSDRVPAGRLPAAAAVAVVLAILVHLSKRE